LAVWLRSARKDEKVLDLSKNIIAADSLDLPSTFSRLGQAPGSFDLVVGNPPWGGELDPSIYQHACAYLGLPADGTWDSWELFLMLGIRALREGGRLALVLPDSFFYPHKARLRKLLFEHTNVEKVHSLGPDWFGPNVRMGTVVIQARRGQTDLNTNILCTLLTGKLRVRAITGQVPLTQIESQRSRLIPSARVVNSSTSELEVFRGLEDDRIIHEMASHSTPFSGGGGLCERARGEEINKAGLLWICPSCLNPTTPGAKNKGGGYKDKNCETCGNLLTGATVDSEILVPAVRPTTDYITFIDGDDINCRYTKARPKKWLRLGVAGWSYKDAAVYRPPKILLRQAGVGICATLDESRSRCPQSVYIYRLRAEQAAKGYRHEFVLAALLSRTMAYLVFKRFGEIDPAKAHAKLTHERLADLPIPVANFNRPSEKEAHDRIVENVRKLLDGAKLGEEEDREIEQLLRDFWGLSSEDGAYVNGEFFDVPESQALRDLFPNGPPKPVTVRVPA
ncbi:MAG: TaqI-like C-terminal specificity domain-containing protein, partial [Thermoguttaceae bacterium]